MTTDGRSPTSLPSTRLCARRVDVAGEYESEADDEMLRACQSDQTDDAYRTRLVPGPADRAVAHEPRLPNGLVAD